MNKINWLFVAATVVGLAAAFAYPTGAQFSPGGGGGTPGGSDTQVQFNDVGAFGGNSAFTFAKSSGLLKSTSLAIGGATPGTDALAVTGTASISGRIQNSGVSFSPTIDLGNVYTGLALFERIDTTGGRVGVGYDGIISGLFIASSGSVQWSSLTTNPAASLDLFLRRDAANTLAQRNGTNAQSGCTYNTFTNSSNGEKFCIDWITNTNVATIGAQANGTGVVRPVSIVGAGIEFGISNLTLTNGAVGMAKITASGSAPGAGGAKLELVCGTVPGSAKLVIAAGTSATVVTVVDNIGAGVTGC